MEIPETKVYRNLKNTHFESFDLSIDNLFKQGEAVSPCTILRDSDGLELYDPMDALVKNTSMQTNYFHGVKICTDFLCNPSTQQKYVFFVSFNYHTEININDRGKQKPLNRCSQLVLYHHFRHILLGGMALPFNLEFCYTFFEQNMEGKIHFHQLIYLRDASPWSYKSCLLNALNPHKRDSKACKISTYDGKAEDLMEYMFNKKTKAYEIINQSVYQPFIYFNIEK